MIQFASLPQFAIRQFGKLAAASSSVCLLATIGSANKLNAANHQEKEAGHT